MMASEPYILIVDDDPDAQEILERILKFKKYNTRTANNGQEAMMLVYEEKPALILLDLNMPIMDGFGMLTQLRGTPATRYIPVVVVTAVSQDQLRQLELPGVKGVLQKGMLSPAAIFDLVESTLTK